MYSGSLMEHLSRYLQAPASTHYIFIILYTQGRAQELAEGGLRQISNVHVPTRKVHVATRKVHVPTRVALESTCKQCVDTHTYIMYVRTAYTLRARSHCTETSISASQIFWERNLRFGVSAFAETPTFDIFLAESLEKVVSVLFFLTSFIVVNFGKFWVMRWTIENEELPLSLYFEVKTRYEKKRKKDVERCKWIAGKLRDEAKLNYSTTLVAN